MLEAIKIRLRVKGELTPEIERRILEFERICIAEIRSEALRCAVLDYLENQCPIEFFTAPASPLGDRHPEWQSLPGGILLNTVECCIGADRTIRMYPSLTTEAAEPKDEAHDVVYAATVLTDTFKAADYGKPWNEWSHHIRAADEWQKVVQKHEIPRPVADGIASAIRWHLGRFTPDWPKGKDPRTLDLLDFIVHALDMDFSNRRLSDVFQRRLGEVSESASAGFVDKEFETAASYFQHVEGKLNNLLVFFATLLVAVISGSYYIGSGDMFKNLTFAHTPRAFLISLLLITFTLISMVFVGVYTELRVRKIRMLEEMAAIRGYQIGAAARTGTDIRPAITMVSSVPQCPPYLRRPSEDWYTLLLITISSASAFAVAIPFLIFGMGSALELHPLPHRYLIRIVEGLIAFLFVGYSEFAWFTRFCYQMDLERKAKFSQAQYVFFSKHGQSFPWPLAWLDSLANWIEQRYRAAVARLSNKSKTS
jgi:hypothetical protein